MLKFLKLIPLLVILLTSSPAQSQVKRGFTPVTFSPVIDKAYVCYRLCTAKDCQGMKYVYFIGGQISSIGIGGKYKTWVMAKLKEGNTGSPMTQSFLPKDGKHSFRHQFYVKNKVSYVQILVAAEYEIAIETPKGLFKNILYFVTDKLKTNDITACGDSL